MKQFMVDIDKEIANRVKDPTHYLLLGMKNHHEYYQDFKRALSFLLPKLNKRQAERLLYEKLQISERPFAVKAFIQSACETTVCASFVEKYSTFKYEVRLNPENKRNVECQFKDAGFLYNVEVKCPDFTALETSKQDLLKVRTMGRIPDYQDDIAELTRLLKEIKPSVIEKNMDNNLKDFLYSANDKFSLTPSESEVNVLIVGCDDVMDIQSWHHYLFSGENPLFSLNSFADIPKYQRVDLVVLTNLYHRHYRYFDKTRLSNSWKLDVAFNLICCNPFRLADKKPAILHFSDVFNNYSNELASYRVPGSAPDYVKDSGRIVSFVKDELETKKGIFCFQPEDKTPAT